MTTVPTAKKGEALEETREHIDQLEPAGEDFMSVAELRKLFNNVNVLIELAKKMAERVEGLEKRIEELVKGG